MKNAKGKGKKGVKGKKEMYDLIVNIDLAEWRLTVEQVFICYLSGLNHFRWPPGVHCYSLNTNIFSRAFYYFHLSN